MKRQTNDFKAPATPCKQWYDLREDWELIEASLAKQYGIRIRQHKDMPWAEFETLVSGLMPDTPLGQIVSIRSETDQNTIKGFNSDQKRIHSDWQRKQAAKRLKNPEQLVKDMSDLEKMLANLFGKGAGK